MKQLLILAVVCGLLTTIVFAFQTQIVPNNRLAVPAPSPLPDRAYD